MDKLNNKVNELVSDNEIATTNYDKVIVTHISGGDVFKGSIFEFLKSKLNEYPDEKIDNIASLFGLDVTQLRTCE